jgi:hypothetical protein
MRILVLALACLAAGCASAPPMGAAPVLAQLSEQLLGADLNTTDPSANRKVSRGKIAASRVEGPCTLTIATSETPAVLTIDFGRLIFVYEDDHDDSIGFVQRGRGQPAVSFFVDPARYDAVWNGFKTAARACGSRPDWSEPLVMR